ncbi:Lon protease [Poriferisphaera corsica]|uniref:Lon protease n=1 Tax=Poriferisphaera corsica TaxID=2528020 RepID=A0A517YSU6_9BACT|nr:LON peptidase substrate-binding domain-containing protein [Poriferisphaera corsica]QDU33309.1 Lon protease [Poriferisphaera corsica]
MPERAIDFSKPIPLFPLGSCVLLPHTTVPLTIFEPRYRVMVEDALGSDRIISMGIYSSDSQPDDHSIRECVCVGYIAKYEMLAGGRYHILLQGICRAKIIEEVIHTPYRKVTVQPTTGDQIMEIDLQEERARIERLLHDSRLMGLSSIGAVNHWLSSEIPTDTLIDQTTLMTCSDNEIRYSMLRERDVYQRAAWLTEYLQKTRHLIEIAEKYGLPRSDDGYCLN